MSTVQVELARRQWEEGSRRFDEQARRQPQLLVALEVVTDELRKRIGQTFTLDELTSVYERADDWVRLARASLVPLLTVLLTMGFGDFKKLPWVSLSAMFQPVEGLRPHVEEPVVQILRKAGVDAQDSLAYAARMGDVLRIVPAADDGTRSITAGTSKTGWGRIVAPLISEARIPALSPKAWKNGLTMR